MMDEFPERSHDIVEVPPRHTSRNQRAVLADHDNHVFLNPSRTRARVFGREKSDDKSLSIAYIPEGGNSLLDPERLRIAGVVVSVESLLFAIKQLQDTGAVI